MSPLVRIVALACLGHVVLSHALWFPDGWLAPVGIDPSLAGALSVLVVVTSLAALARPSQAAPWFLAALVVRCGLDRALWQTYVLEYVALLALACGKRDRESMIWLWGLLFVWAGLHKLNPDFVSHGLELFTGTATPAAANITVALVEALAGVALVVPRTRRTAAILIVGFSVVVSSWFVATQHNLAVVPWNLAHACAIPWALQKKRDTATRHLVGVLVVFGVLPAATYVGYPAYLGCRVYTASAAYAELWVQDRVQLPANAPSTQLDHPRFAARVSLSRWAHDATNASLPPDAAVFEAIAARVCQRGDALLVITPQRTWSDPAPDRVYRACRSR